MQLLEFGAVTDRGTVRELNEDSILAVPPVFVVADGVGGSEAGEVASALLVEQFAQLAEQPVIDADGVQEAIQDAHRRIRRLHDGRSGGASTTAVGAVGVLADAEPYWVVFNVGDSRIFRLTSTEDQERELTQVSVDHSHVQELVDAGVISADQADSHPDRNLVTRAVGADVDVQADFWMIPMVPGDRFLICSDGLQAVAADVIEDWLRRPVPPTEVVDELLGLALAAGATDNVSLIVVDILSGAQQPATSSAAEATTVQDRR